MSVIHRLRSPGAGRSLRGSSCRKVSGPLSDRAMSPAARHPEWRRENSLTSLLWGDSDESEKSPRAPAASITPQLCPPWHSGCSVGMFQMASFIRQGMCRRPAHRDASGYRAAGLCFFSQRDYSQPKPTPAVSSATSHSLVSQVCLFLRGD